MRPSPPANRAADERASGLSLQARLASAPRARAGAATCPARRRRACGCSCAPAAMSRASARPRATRRPGARATRKRASACTRAPNGRGRPAGARWQPPAARLRAGSSAAQHRRWFPSGRSCARTCRCAMGAGGVAPRPTWRAGVCPARACGCIRPRRCALRVDWRSLAHGPDSGLCSGELPRDRPCPAQVAPATLAVQTKRECSLAFASMPKHERRLCLALGERPTHNLHEAALLYCASACEECRVCTLRKGCGKRACARQHRAANQCVLLGMYAW